MKISFITTVFNEENNVEVFMKSLFSQTRMPDEIVIVDGGSTDTTVKRIKNYELGIKGKDEILKQVQDDRKKKINFKLIVKQGNRAVGRNVATKNATGDIIVCSDFGCILDKNWIKNITKKILHFVQDDRCDVVAGYYKGKAESVFQKCLIPYVLVMEDRVNAKDFLPSTRSIAFRKKVWEKVGGFPEKYSHNEDYVFAKSLKKINAKIVFAKDAIVYWLPRKNIGEAFIMFFRFAYGDAQAKIYRPKVIFLFLRYLIAVSLLVVVLITKSFFLISIFSFLIFLYLLWSISKNYHYVKCWQAIFILPLLQLTADIAVISGTVFGLAKVF